MGENIGTVLKEELRRVAPDIDASEIDRDDDLRDAFDIDSMDFLTLVTSLEKRLSIKVPEADYPQMSTFNDLADYLSERTASD
ncbi:MAG: acyl carrier protein [Rhodobacteraceae bacterium]|nr:acyl carrier protein [Paracoccaceae bacterium]